MIIEAEKVRIPSEKSMRGNVSSFCWNYHASVLVVETILRYAPDGAHFVGEGVPGFAGEGWIEALELWRGSRD